MAAHHHQRLPPDHARSGPGSLHRDRALGISDPFISGLGSLRNNGAPGIPDPAITMGQFKERKPSQVFQQHFYLVNVKFAAGNNHQHDWAKDWKNICEHGRAALIKYRARFPERHYPVSHFITIGHVTEWWEPIAEVTDGNPDAEIKYGAEWRELVAKLSSSSSKFLDLYIFATTTGWHVRYSFKRLKGVDNSFSVLRDEVEALEEFFEKNIK
ncbi:hypothetical protein BZA77DRAFT_359253 [Pyronema omphalodes]|nr:hypothetical protein BZA77DRAFT_359253 [Pyronema omphalodes]